MGQELYVFTDPASNVPKSSVSLKYAGKWVRERNLDHEHGLVRHMLESSLGVSRHLMLRPAITMGNMYSGYPSTDNKFESLSLYAKWRIYSQDDVHKHLRAALFMKGVYSRNNLKFDEITADGDQTGIQAGMVLTKLQRKLAVSSSLSFIELLDKERFMKYYGPRNFGYQSFHYSLSAGYLLFPRKYQGYRQTNFNLYCELLGSNGIDKGYAILDIAPAAQLIFNSNTKLNIGYRTQLSSNAYRMSRSGFQVSIERTFLNINK
jgi:hypothetical protein